MKKLLSCLLSCFLLFTACGPMIKVVEVESLMPAKYPVAYSDKSIAILNALHTNNLDGSVSYTDSLLTNRTAKGLKEEMETSEIFRDYDIPVYNLNLICDEIQCDELQDINYMNSIAEQTEASLLIVIDSVEMTQAQQSINQVSVSAYSRGFYTIGDAFLATTIVPYKAMFRYYDVVQQRYIVNYALQDTVLLEAMGNKATEAVAKLPQGDEVYPMSAEKIGQLMAKASLPYWKSDRRYYYELSGSNGYVANTYAEKRDWKQAMQYWGQIAMEASGKTAAYAAFNMALGAEMLGDYPLAIEWLTLAKGKSDLPEIDGYVKRLQQRIADKKLIEQQLEN